MTLITDKQINYRRHTLFVPAGDMQGAGKDTDLTVVTSRAIYGWEFVGAAGLDVGSIIEGRLPIPKTWDPTWPLGIRPIWTTAASNAASSATWLALMSVVPTGFALVTAASGALDTVIGADVIATSNAFLYNRGNRGVRNGGWATNTQIDNGAILNYGIELDAVVSITLASTSVWLLGVEFDFVPRMTRQPHRELDAPISDSFG